MLSTNGEKEFKKSKLAGSAAETDESTSGDIFIEDNRPETS